ncbi:hypothetical protein [Phocaeicola coprophilus]|nr:hypothetical protein [Phocaeicola coprophilus]
MKENVSAFKGKDFGLLKKRLRLFLRKLRRMEEGKGRNKEAEKAF